MRVRGIRRAVRPLLRPTASEPTRADRDEAVRDKQAVTRDRHHPAVRSDMHDYSRAIEQQGLAIIGNAVRRRRVASGTSQRQLGFWAGINQSTVSRLETGRLRTMRL